MRTRVALATNDEYPELVGGEVLLLDAFLSSGYDARPVVWNDQSVEWKQYDYVIIRSCWGYHEQVDEFRAWLDVLAMQGIELLNPQEIVRWNMHKGYLLELQQAGVPIAQTVLVPQGDTRTLGEVLDGLSGDAFIIKPCYGADAFGVMKVTKVSAIQQVTQDIYTGLLAQSDVLVQPFVPEIINGEISAIFLNGAFSHAVIKKPQANDFRSQPKYGGVESRLQLDVATLSLVHKLYTLCNKKTLYARLDIVLTDEGPVLMELELIEPYLFFDFDGDAADRFVEAFGEFTKPSTTDIHH